ncbi:WYL domain-containing protein [Eikenella sp. S3360]|uniref:WYL domain-containing protein n=1 Tax=Eikenella glucosivorans TaxID=2766967 RepID=A0ABS0N7P0_9NEIS|nr:WYL domain-containing protein [Eikenella glucosivorans]MBH5328316.1 WYL domain-containing protein [Eikenella glucosivorans]
MPTRSETFDTALVYLEILRIIPKTRYIGIQDICRHLDGIGIRRDKRTIQRIMHKLCEHFEIEADTRSKPYGYRWKSHAKGLEVPLLNASESLVLALAQQQLKYLLPANIMHSMEPLFTQAQYTLRFDRASTPERAWQNKICIAPTSQPLLPAALDQSILDTVGSALFEDRMLEIEYRNQSGMQYVRRVMPLALVQQEPVLYLVVRFDGYRDNRHLALHRIISAKLLQRPFERPSDFNLQQYLSDGHFGFGSGQSVRLRFSIRREAGFHLTETPLSADQHILASDNTHYRFEATVIDSAMLDWWLAKFGNDVWDIEKQAPDLILNK